MKNITIEKGNVLYEIDYRLELLAIIEALINYQKEVKQFGINNQGEYYQDIINNFGSYKNHPLIIKMMNIMEKHGFYFDAPVNLFLQLDNSFNCDELNSYVFSQRLESDEEIYDIIKMLKPFSEEINYDCYYNNNRDLYKKYLNDFVMAVDDCHIMSFLENYTGISFNNKRCHISLMPLIERHNYGAQLPNDVYACIGLPPGFNNEPRKFQAGLSKLIVHEFLHSIINPITEQLALINSDEEMFYDIKEAMKNKAYGTSNHIIDEHIIRAITLRYLYYNFSNNYYNRSFENELTNHFIYIPNIINSLVEYENNRDYYKTIKDFYKVIIDNMRDDMKKSK